jgi:hypothetical protein
LKEKAKTWKDADLETFLRGETRKVVAPNSWKKAFNPEPRFQDKFGSRFRSGLALDRGSL